MRIPRWLRPQPQVLRVREQHTWIKDKVIVCPNKDKPSVKEAAEKNYQEYIATFCKQNKKRKESKEKPFDYSSLSAKDKAAAPEGILSASGHVRTKRPGSPRTRIARVTAPGTPSRPG